MATDKLTAEALESFCGTCEYHGHWLGLQLTDGAAYLYRNGAAWLIDAIASHQPEARRRVGDFQVWTLSVRGDRSALLECRADAGEAVRVSQRFDWTDFPLLTVKLFVQGRVVMLSNEY